LAKCSGITQAGTACRGIPIGDSQWCYAHHPDHQEERRRHGARGGKRAGRGRPTSELANIKGRLSDLADDVLAEHVDRGVAAVASQVLNVYLRAVSVELRVREVETLAREVEELRDLVEASRSQGQRSYGA
jgi:hypothetical protein